jgi:carbon monoxide dehydrogenase subunit G
MAQYKSKPTIIGRSAESIAEKFSDLSVMQSAIENLPEEEHKRIGEVTFKSDCIEINTQQVGQIRFRVTERSAQRIAFAAEGSPVPLVMQVDLKPVGAEQTEITTVIEVDIPVFLKPMVGGAMQKAADQFGAMISRLS